MLQCFSKPHRTRFIKKFLLDTYRFFSSQAPVNKHAKLYHRRRVTFSFGTVSLWTPFSVADSCQHFDVWLLQLNKDGCVGGFQYASMCRWFFKVLTKRQNRVIASRMICHGFISNFCASLRNNVAATFAWKRVFRLTHFLFFFFFFSLLDSPVTPPACPQLW